MQLFPRKNKFSLIPPASAKRVAIGGLATGGFATLFRPIAALAIGAFAIGSLAIKRLAVRSLKIGYLEVDDIKINEHKLPLPKTGLLLTHFLTVSDPERSAKFYSDILGGETVLRGTPSIVKVANSWIILNVGGGPTDDKPEVTLQPPKSSREVSSFLNIRVANIKQFYKDWKKKGAEFLTEPKNHKYELRCYMKDPDGYLIEVGQTKEMPSELAKAA